jgi:hypothetical protein
MEFSLAIEKTRVKELLAVVPRSSLFPAQKAAHPEHSVLAIRTVFDRVEGSLSHCMLPHRPHRPHRSSSSTCVL